MRDHNGEEHRIEPREGTVESGDQTPHEGKVEIAGVVNLSGIAVCVWVSSRPNKLEEQLGGLTPSVNKDRITLLASNSSWVFDGLPWKLRESLSQNHVSALLLAETVLLAVRRIPDPVNENVGDVHSGKGVFVPAIGGRVVAGKVNSAMTVAEGNTGKVPEDKHEAQFLVVHIPTDD